MAIKAITTDSFRDDVLKTRKPVLIKFWVPWCGYCRALAPALESIEKQYESLISVGRVNFDTETALVRRYNIHALPTLLLFINGAVAGFLIDPSSEKEIDVFLRKMLGLNAGGLYGKYVDIVICRRRSGRVLCRIVCRKSRSSRGRSGKAAYRRAGGTEREY